MLQQKAIHSIFTFNFWLTTETRLTTNTLLSYPYCTKRFSLENKHFKRITSASLLMQRWNQHAKYPFCIQLPRKKLNTPSSTEISLEILFQTQFPVKQLSQRKRFSTNFIEISFEREDNRSSVFIPYFLRTDQPNEIPRPRRWVSKEARWKGFPATVSGGISL